jgi:hypothetical protein
MHASGAAPAGHLVERLAHVHLLVVQRLGARAVAGHREPRGEAVDRDDARGPEQVRARARELTDRPAPPDRDDVAWLDVAGSAAM